MTDGAGLVSRVAMIIPTYREAPNVIELVRGVKAVGHERELDIEMMVMHDRSDDGTAEVLRALGEGD